jgi:uridine kinase
VGELARVMKKLLTNPLFGLGLGIRLLMIAALLPQASANWYTPFLAHSLSSPSLDPWSTFLLDGGNAAAFPYGYVMWLAFLPLTLLCKLVGLSLHLGYGATLLAADTAMMLTLNRLYPGRLNALLSTYWLSPIVLLASYWLGLNDIVPVLLLCLALANLPTLRFGMAGFLCGAAISAKLSMVLALPFFLIYLFQNKALRLALRPFSQGLAIAFVLFGLPFLVSHGGLFMLLHNPEMGKVYQFSLEIGNGTRLYLLPLAYLLTLYVTWRVRRLNFELFSALLGLAFFLVVLMTPASPGWFIWILPLLVAYQLRSDRIAWLLVSAFSTLYAIGNVLVIPGPHLTFSDVGSLTLGPIGPPSLVHTLITALGIALGMRIWRETVSSNDYFRLSRKPFVIGIGGDSGAGKDTLVDAMTGLFGQHSVAKLSGDDYHLWDRQKPMWQVMTHLNPMANDLEAYANDLVALSDGRAISSRHYDHASGKMSHPIKVKSNDFIIASGLHALYLPILRNCYDLSVYLDINEGLRRHLKLQRDVHQRGHSPERVLNALAMREPDSERFVRPQAEHADLIMSLQPIHPRLLEDTSGTQVMRYKLQVRSRMGLNEMSLTRTLTGICGLHVEMTMSQDGQEVELIIEGETSSEDMALAAQMLFPQILAFLDIRPAWENGVLGLMQLITLSHINQALKKRFLW